ncbi:uncharacterized protein BDCG_16918 [Blastomyces dermatitidis ER-3]|uniref:Uncharacterized protein n=1 Tax=Ajellomyces dermatitidis (strain ER-3 / ATCC MYA-2586) TaxID=559297 RepID=A0ABX2VVC8_AJEDR|nr:uncharacterized protein BDCG_16918 [Blastomyces dermatitidis ER-3]OAT01109.1 hypothetical protein BDCG_16918 [Blastomyces dermatitidis ER-3]
MRFQNVSSLKRDLGEGLEDMDGAKEGPERSIRRRWSFWLELYLRCPVQLNMMHFDTGKAIAGGAQCGCAEARSGWGVGKTFGKRKDVLFCAMEK